MKDFPIGEIVPFGASYLGNRHFIYMSVFHISDPFLFIYWHIARQLTLGEGKLQPADVPFSSRAKLEPSSLDGSAAGAGVCSRGGSDVHDV